VRQKLGRNIFIHEFHVIGELNIGHHLANFFPPVRAQDLGLKLPDYVHVYTFPAVSSYVGGDIVAGILGSGVFQREELTLFMDVGTNGELVLGNCDWLVCTSCSAGPAFEGGGIKYGMRATTGAIEQIRINPQTYEPMLITIGKEKPLGICGSGIIDAIAEMLLVNIIEPNGKFKQDLETDRIRKGETGWEYVLAEAEQSADGIDDITITEGDIDNIIRTKGAIYAGCRILLESVGLTFEELDSFIIAGGFGKYINLERAITIGLLPEIDLEKFMFIGNGALLGDRLVSVSREMMGEAQKVGCRDIGIFAQVFGVYFKEKLAHSGVCCNHQMGYLLFFNTSHGHQVVDYFVEIFDDLSVQLVQAIAFLRVDDTGDDILTKTNL